MVDWVKALQISRQAEQQLWKSLVGRTIVGIDLTIPETVQLTFKDGQQLQIDSSEWLTIRKIPKDLP